jgi:hypothetical protein
MSLEQMLNLSPTNKKKTSQNAMGEKTRLGRGTSDFIATFFLLARTFLGLLAAALRFG